MYIVLLYIFIVNSRNHLDITMLTLTSEIQYGFEDPIICIYSLSLLEFLICRKFRNTYVLTIVLIIVHSLNFVNGLGLGAYVYRQTVCTNITDIKTVIRSLYSCLSFVYKHMHYAPNPIYIIDIKIN